VRVVPRSVGEIVEFTIRTELLNIGTLFLLMILHVFHQQLLFTAVLAEVLAVLTVHLVRECLGIRHAHLAHVNQIDARCLLILLHFSQLGCLALRALLHWAKEPLLLEFSLHEPMEGNVFRLTALERAHLLGLLLLPLLDAVRAE